MDIIKPKDRIELIQYINLKLVAMGLPSFQGRKIVGEDFVPDGKLVSLYANLIHNYQEKNRLLGDLLCPADRRIQNFIDDYFKDCDCDKSMDLPNQTFVLDQKGLAREMSLPPDKNEYKTELISSYRINQGVLHNPVHDRRTTKGSFHIVEGGLPIPLDKKAVPKNTFAHLFHAAVNPSPDMLELPFTASIEDVRAETFVSLLLRPLVCPEVKGVIPEKSMEVRFFAPGSLVSNLDFVESIFGNAGDPQLSINDAALDFDHWTGHTGCIILAPHLTSLKKKDIGLPNIKDATERQKKEGMCWEDENELYNDGTAFKITCRDDDGVVITLIADNYYGYSKKEIKTQISYSANLYGIVEEEHAGGAIAFPRKNLGETFHGEYFKRKLDTSYTFEEVKKEYAELMDIQPENYAIDKQYPHIIYIPENADVILYETLIKWEYKENEYSIRLSPENIYVLPSGHKLHMEKHATAPSWRLVSTFPEGTFCHKPCTVSGGGKSEISKPLENNLIFGSLYINDKEKDFELVDKIFNYDYTNRWKSHEKRNKPSRPLLSPERSLGSVVKLLTPSSYCTDEYNEFLDSIPDSVRALVLFIKRFYRPERDGKSWRDYFSVNQVNGKNGHTLLYNGRSIFVSFLRMGFALDGSWNLIKLRTDFLPSKKLQMEDDISASVVLPASRLKYLNKDYKNKSLKFTVNCESFFFQRPDEAIHKGFDKQTEEDLSKKRNFTTNYQPLRPENGKELMANAIEFDKYTKPIRRLIKKGSKGADDTYFMSPSHPRLVDGKPTKNPRYLQKNPALSNMDDYYLAEVGVRLHRKIPLDEPVHWPVNAVLPGRRNNPPDKEAGIRALSVYNPIHYQELPELFMDFICSLTGKSPSTTGAGSEGALTKGPFNMLIPTTDLNNALLSYILTGYEGYTTAAGYIGSHDRFDHDISILIPELWSRLEENERDPRKLIEEGSLEKIEDFEFEGRQVLASRLGYRITEAFLFRYMGRILSEPQATFSEQTLKPELQDMEAFVDGINNIVEAQQKVALNYFEDGSINSAIPPLEVLLHVMAYGHYKGKQLSDPKIRKMFTREDVIKQVWYNERLQLKRVNDINLWEKRINYLENFMAQDINKTVTDNMNLKEKLVQAEARLEYVRSYRYIESLIGTIGADPLCK